jgi:hypothetical protein
MGDRRHGKRQGTMRTGIGLEVLGHGVSFSYRAEDAALLVFAAPLSLLMLEICKPAFAIQNIFIRSGYGVEFD